jgi:hypothetical protein
MRNKQAMYITCSRQFSGLTLGGFINNFVSYPVTCTVIGEIIFAQVSAIGAVCRVYM